MCFLVSTTNNLRNIALHLLEVKTIRPLWVQIMMLESIERPNFNSYFHLDTKVFWSISDLSVRALQGVLLHKKIPWCRKIIGICIFTGPSPLPPCASRQKMWARGSGCNTQLRWDCNWAGTCILDISYFMSLPNIEPTLRAVSDWDHFSNFY